MIFPKTKLKVIDNSGINILKCFKINGALKKNGKEGDLCYGSIYTYRDNSTFKKKIVRAVITNTKTNKKKMGGEYIKGSQNTCILINDTSSNLIGKRIKEAISINVLKNKQLNIWKTTKHFF